jgi:hypothetical protein
MGRRCNGPASVAGQGGADGRCARSVRARPGQGRADGWCVRPGQGRAGRLARCWVGRGRRSARVTRRGVAEAGGAGPGGTRPGQGGARPGGAWLRQEGLGRERLRQGRCALQGGARRQAHDRGKAGPGRGREGQSRGGRRVGSGESVWSVRGEETAERRRAGRAEKNEKMNGIHKLGA